MNNKTKFNFMTAVSSAAFLALIGLLAVLFTQAERWVGLGLVGHIWYLVLIFVGSLCAICLFYLFKSYGRYSGKALGGKVELGGPGVLMLVIVVLGVRFEPDPPMDFDFTLLVVSAEQEALLVSQGRIRMDLGDNPAMASIGAAGEARFANIPARFNQQKVRVSLIDGYPYKLVESSREVSLIGEVAYLTVEAQTVMVQGTVESPEGQAVAGAQVLVGEQTQTTRADGRFRFELPADMPQISRVIEIKAKGFPSWRSRFALTGAPMVIQLRR